MASTKAQRFYVARWILAFTALGGGLVILAYRLAISQSGPITFTELHREHSIMWLVDLLPTVLGLSGLVIGWLYVRLVDARNDTEVTAQRIAAAWTADLHTANMQLVESLQERQRFYAAMSHEMRTPLAAIVGYSDLTAELRIAPTEVDGYLAEIYGSAGALLEIVNDLLDAARVETGGITIELSDVDGTEIASTVARRLSPLAAQKGQSIKLELSDGAVCRGDADRVRQVLTNLVANAIKYSDSGVITLRLGSATDGWQFDVIDQGAGIAPEDLERVFRAFERTDVAQGRTDSTGLGLAVSRTFAEAMGGRVFATSPGVGMGSTFSLWIPAATGATAQEAEVGSLAG